MTALAAQSTIAPPPNVPLVGIVAVRLPEADYAMRSTWLDPKTLIVGYDPDRLTRGLVEMLLTAELGTWTDLDAEVTR